MDWIFNPYFFLNTLYFDYISTSLDCFYAYCTDVNPLAILISKTILVSIVLTTWKYIEILKGLNFKLNSITQIYVNFCSLF